MKKYEITFLAKEESASPSPVIKEIEALGGKIVSAVSLGQKQLVYPIKKEKNAFYTTSLFEIKEEKIFDLNRKLNLNDSILRYLIIVAPKQQPKPVKKEEITGTAKPVQAEKPAKEKEITVKEETLKKEIKPKEKVVKKVPKEETVDKKERLEALDKKLDELLKE